jgi:hypothetical protein
VRYVYPCRLGTVTDACTDGVAVPLASDDLRLPAGTRHAAIRYRLLD